MVPRTAPASMRSVYVRGGSSFEMEVYNAIAAALANNAFGVLPDACRLHRQKGYHSRDRGADIVVDVSIEVYLPGANTWSLLWAWECKDLTRPVGVDDV